MPAFSAFFRANFPGTPPGSFIRTIARLHEDLTKAVTRPWGSDLETALR